LEVLYHQQLLENKQLKLKLKQKSLENKQLKEGLEEQLLENKHLRKEQQLNKTIFNNTINPMYQEIIDQKLYDIYQGKVINGNLR
jgi:hypothetical protein